MENKPEDKKACQDCPKASNCAIPTTDYENERIVQVYMERQRKEEQEYKTIVVVLYLHDEPFYCFSGSKEFYDFLKEKLSYNNSKVTRNELGASFKLLNIRQYLYNGTVKIDCKLL